MEKVDQFFSSLHNLGEGLEPFFFFCLPLQVGPTYHNLGDHTETVDVDYDPEVTTYEEMLKTFWKNHDPSSRCSRQYMSAIFYHDDRQRAAAERTKDEEEKRRRRKVNTLILPMEKFYLAEGWAKIQLCIATLKYCTVQCLNTPFLLGINKVDQE